MRGKTIVLGLAGLMLSQLAAADSIHEYNIVKHVKMNAGQTMTVKMPCDGTDAAFRGGAYIVKANGTIAPYNNPVMQQVPIYDADQDKIIGLQFGLGNGAKDAKNVAVWVSCLSDNNG